MSHQKSQDTSVTPSFHAFYPSLEDWQDAVDDSDPIYAVSLIQDKPTGIQGITERKGLYHLSQLDADKPMVHHCLMDVYTIVLPLDRDTIEKATTHMQILEVYLDVFLNTYYKVRNGQIAYPRNLMIIKAQPPLIDPELYKTLCNSH